jgi:hypothetical protein
MGSDRYRSRSHDSILLLGEDGWFVRIACVCLLVCALIPNAAIAEACLNASDGSLTLDLNMVQIWPELRINGAPFITSEEDSVEIWLAQDGILQVLLGKTHETPGSVNVVVGTYDLVYRDLSPGNPTLPQNTSATFQKSVVIANTGMLIADVPSAAILGKLTLDGADFPASILERGAVYAVGTAGQGEVFLGNTNDGIFFRTLIGGEYDIVYRHMNGGGITPINKNAVVATMNLNPGLPLFEIDLSTFNVSGSFSFNGVPAPASILESGTVELRHLSANGLQDHLDLGRTKDQTYTMKTIIAGSYDAYFLASLSSNIAPRNVDSMFASNLRVNGTTLDLDINTTSYEGTFTVNGVVAVASILEYGVVSFIDPQTGAETIIGETRDQTFDFEGIPGSYHLVYRRINGGSFVPQNSFAILSDNHDFPDGGQIIVPLPIDIPMTETSIALTMDGAPWNPADGSATIRLLNPDGSVSLDLGSTDLSPWLFKLVSDSYRINYFYDSGSMVPRNVFATLPDVQTISDLSDSITFDLRTLDLAPTVLVNGEGFPDAHLATLSMINGQNLLYFETGPGHWISRRILRDAYQINYGHSSGAEIPQNIAYQQDCADLRPICIFCDGFEDLIP